jgi:hypothetical protein
MEESTDGIRIGHSRATDPTAAVAELRRAIFEPNAELVIFFCAPTYDLSELCAQLNRQFAGAVVVGCTTAGEIGPAGYLQAGIVAVSLRHEACAGVVERIDDLRRFGPDEARRMAQKLRLRLEEKVGARPAGEMFGFMLIDGLSMREESVARAVQSALGNVFVVGGSAGDNLSFRRTHVFHDGAFHNDSAIVLLATTTRPFRIFKTQHFVRTPEKLVVTEAEPETRTVREINGLPAAAEYARLIGTSANELDPVVFAANPVAVAIGGAEYVRSIQKANPDGSLTFFCVIDEGVVLTLTRGSDILQHLEATFAELSRDVGPPRLVLACDCILRQLELDKNGVKELAGDILRRNNVVGFSTYGEQYKGIHVNQTMTGIAFG